MVERIVEVLGLKKRSWYFDLPFVISNPELNNNKKKIIGLDFFHPLISLTKMMRATI